MEPFVTAATGVAAQWQELGSADARGAGLIVAANAQLQSIGVPACRPAIHELPPGVWGRFDWEPWMLEMDKTGLSKHDLEQAEALRLAAVVYHEARHAEQLFNVARLLAGKNKTQAEIRASTGIKESVVAQACAQPLGADDPRAAAAESHHESIFGAGAAARDKLRTELKAAAENLAVVKQRHTQIFQTGDRDAKIAANQELTEATRRAQGLKAQYKSLPEEADAWAVQAEMEALFSQVVASS